MKKGPIKVLEPMYQLEQRRPSDSDFIKCHRSYLVNFRHVDSINAKEIKLHSGSVVPISRNHAKEFQETFFAYTFEK